MTTFSIAKQFSSLPGPRYRDLGQNSAEELREDHLIPLLDTLKPGEVLRVDLDGLVCFPPSYGEEIFGGLVWRRGAGVINRIRVVSAEIPDWIERAVGYMNDMARVLEPMEGDS